MQAYVATKGYCLSTRVESLRMQSDVSRAQTDGWVRSLVEIAPFTRLSELVLFTTDVSELDVVLQR